MPPIDHRTATLGDLIALADWPDDLARAGRALRGDALQGDPDAAFKLAVLFYEGHFGRREVIEGLTFLRQAAAAGHEAAGRMLERVMTSSRDQFVIGHALVYGLGTPADPATGLVWLRKAAGQGMAGAQELLGRCLYGGIGAPADPPEGVAWFRAAAEQGDPDAQWCLARALHEGRGVAADADEAMAWTRRSAEGGNVSAQYALALALRDGAGGLAPDPAEAARRMAELVELGHVSATEQLGLMYVDGVGVPFDPQHGISLLVRAKRDRGGLRA